MTTEDKSLHPNIKPHRISIANARVNLGSVLDFCKDRFGHRGERWWWKVNNFTVNGKIVLSFKDKNDALIVKLWHGESQYEEK